jgi:surface protein
MVLNTCETLSSVGFLCIYYKPFNQAISNWDVSSVTYMESMFQYVSQFNHNISGWNVSLVTTMEYMFSRGVSIQPRCFRIECELTDKNSFSLGCELSDKHGKHVRICIRFQPRHFRMGCELGDKHAQYYIIIVEAV